MSVLNKTPLEKYILVADSSTWMSVHKGWVFAAAAKQRGYKIIRVAPDARLSWQEDIFILDPLMSEQVLTEKLKKYKGQIAFILPTFDYASTLLAPVAQTLETPFLRNPSARHLGTKALLAKYLQSHGLATPRTWLADSQKAFDDIPDGIPLVTKANVSTGTLKKHDWDYRVFRDKNQLIAYLTEDKQLQAFIVNNQQSERYQSVVQEYIEAEQFLDVHVVFGKTGNFKIFLIGEFFTHPGELLIVESKTVNLLDDDTRMHVEKSALFLSQNGCEYMVANMQFAVLNGIPYLFDLNLRVAGIWSYLHKIMMPNFAHQVLSFFHEENAEFAPSFPYYLKTPYYLEPGKTVESFTAPKSLDPSVMLAYLDHLAAGYKVPESQNSIQPAPQIFAVGTCEQDCRDKIQEVLKNTNVRYRS